MAMPLIEDIMFTGINMKFRFRGNDSLGRFNLRGDLFCYWKLHNG